MEDQDTDCTSVPPFHFQVTRRGTMPTNYERLTVLGSQHCMPLAHVAHMLHHGWPNVSLTQKVVDALQRVTILAQVVNQTAIAK